jgi:hypothetical protein
MRYYSQRKNRFNDVTPRHRCPPCRRRRDPPVSRIPSLLDWRLRNGTFGLDSKYATRMLR